MRAGLAIIFGSMGLAGATAGCSAAVGDKDVGEVNQGIDNETAFANGFGAADFFSTAESIETDPAKNPFFRNLGINGRTCNSCHKLEQGMGISVARINAIFNATNGLDPIFRINDGSNAPTGFYANVSTASARRISFSMLLSKGLIRVGIGIPSTLPGNQINLILAQDPFGFASAAELSLFRRPLPSVNVAANVLAMWDGRESEGRPAIRDALINQANDATQGHAQRPTPLDTTTRQQIADFQLALFNGQITSNVVGALNVAGCVTNADGEPCEEARGGARNAFTAFSVGSPGGSQGGFGPFKEGINSPFRPLCEADVAIDPTDACFKNVSMTFFDPFESDEFPESDTSTLTRNRGELGDGENIFYTKPMFFSNVPGLTDADPPITQGFCTTCHNTPEFGSHSNKRFFNTGLSDPFTANNPLAGNITEFPKYVIGRNGSPGIYTTTTDPGLALRTGRYADIGKFKVPNLRGLGSRAPYFHNGAARTLEDVVNFYNTKFRMQMNSEEIRKVVVFLRQT
jgi:cytochrome c peroxidase